MFRLGFSKDLIALISIFILNIIINNQEKNSELFAYAIAIDQSTILEQSLLIKNERQIININNNNNVTNIVDTKLTPDTTTTTTTFTKTTPSPLPPSNYNDPRRPVWNLAHMVNSIKELDYRLGKGANAVEADVTFSRDGIPIYTYHGPPCDCWRHCHQQEDFNDYLRYVRQIAIEDNAGIGKDFTLLFLDLKLDYLDDKAKGRAGAELASSIMENLFSPSATDISSNVVDNIQTIQTIEGNSIVELTPTTSDTPTSLRDRNFDKNLTIERILTPKNRKFNLILSVNHVTDVELIYNFIYFLEQNNSTHLMSRIGFDVGMNDDIQLIEKMWKRFKNGVNIWQGDGYTNCFSPFYNLERLSRSIVKRDNDLGYPSKVYHWTIDLHDRIRESLMMGVDAIMTNHPERVVSILKEPDMVHNFRLANENDEPFKKITRKTNALNIESARYQRSPISNLARSGGGGGAIKGGFFGNIIDVISSWFAYIREIPLLSFPTTTRFVPKVKRHKSTQTTMLLARNDKQNIVDTNGANLQPKGAAHGGKPLEGEVGEKEKDKENKLLINSAEKELPPYDGPKWYTTVLGNILVSMMKIVLPVSA